MFDATDFREIISGRKRGAIASLARGSLAVPEAIYAATVFTRNRLFDWRLRLARRADVPVISVGNLTVGGTGKSPFVFWIVCWLQGHGLTPAVLSRGYGAAPGSPNDEALELRLRAPELCHLQSANRAVIAHRAAREFDAQILILDDGFQHRQLARDLDIVLLDATEPFGWGRMLPRGLLREPIASLGRAGAVVLTRADRISAEERNRIRRMVERHAPKAVWGEAEFKPAILVDERGREHPLSEVRSAKVFGFAAIGQPDNFRHTAQALAGQLVGFQAFPDHHRYSGDEIAQLVTAAQAASAEFLICTCKDLVKIPPGSCDSVPVRAVRIDTCISAGRSELEQRLRSVVAAKLPR